MNNGTDIRPLSGMHSCSDVFSFDPECMPDKTAGQTLFLGRIRAPFFIGKMGGIAQLVERLVRNEKARGSNPLTSSLRFEARKVEAVTPEVAAATEGGLSMRSGLSPSKTTAWQASLLYR